MPLVNEIIENGKNKEDLIGKYDEKLNPKEKEKWYQGPKAKKGGTTNEQKKKKKNYTMMLQKKIRTPNDMPLMKKSIRKLRKQLGHVRSKNDAKRKLQARVTKSRK